jgi:hypothetical protein
VIPKSSAIQKCRAIQKVARSKKQSNPKSSAIQKAARSKKQRDPKSSAIKWIINSVQRKKAARHQIALSTKKARVHINPITSNRPPIIILPTNYIQLQIHPHQHHIRHP